MDVNHERETVLQSAVWVIWQAAVLYTEAAHKGAQVILHCDNAVIVVSQRPQQCVDNALVSTVCLCCMLPVGDGWLSATIVYIVYDLLMAYACCCHTMESLTSLQPFIA